MYCSFEEMGCGLGCVMCVVRVMEDGYGDEVGDECDAGERDTDTDRYSK